MLEPRAYNHNIMFSLLKIGNVKIIKLLQYDKITNQQLENRRDLEPENAFQEHHYVQAVA
jgi:hypothetical protein